MRERSQAFQPSQYVTGVTFIVNVPAHSEQGYYVSQSAQRHGNDYPHTVMALELEEEPCARSTDACRKRESAPRIRQEFSRWDGAEAGGHCEEHERNRADWYQ
jgi:hypothetical protein